MRSVLVVVHVRDVRELMIDLDFPSFLPSDFVFKIARSQEELRGFWQLRREIFCEEQGLFEESDRDEYDDTMMPILCVSLVLGMEDQVVGVVRIDEREPGLWYGSRLGVRRKYRHLPHLSSSVPQRNRQPDFYGGRSIGAGLIYKAVSTANAIGCRTFLAQVQSQNAPFFEKLHWLPLREMELHGLPHVKMQAELDFYPPADRVC